jgi:hypothetical protein
VISEPQDPKVVGASDRAVDDVVAGLGGRLITKASLGRVLRHDSAPTVAQGVAQAFLTSENPAICGAFLSTATGDSNPVGGP